MHFKATFMINVKLYVCWKMYHENKDDECVTMRKKWKKGSNVGE